MEVIRVFLDANILIAAMKPGGITRALVAWVIHFAEGVSNDYALSEARRHIAKRYPQWLQHLDELVGELFIINHTVPAPSIDLRAKDIPILVGAIASKCTHLLTKDVRDFGPFYGLTIQGVKVMSPAQFVREVIVPRP